MKRDKKRKRKKNEAPDDDERNVAVAELEERIVPTVEMSVIEKKRKRQRRRRASGTELPAEPAREKPTDSDHLEEMYGAFVDELLSRATALLDEYGVVLADSGVYVATKTRKDEEEEDEDDHRSDNEQEDEAMHGSRKRGKNLNSLQRSKLPSSLMKAMSQCRGRYFGQLLGSLAVQDPTVLHTPYAIKVRCAILGFWSTTTLIPIQRILFLNSQLLPRRPESARTVDVLRRISKSHVRYYTRQAMQVPFMEGFLEATRKCSPSQRSPFEASQAIPFADPGLSIPGLEGARLHDAPTQPLGGSRAVGVRANIHVRSVLQIFEPIASTFQHDVDASRAEKRRMVEFLEECGETQGLHNFGDACLHLSTEEEELCSRVLLVLFQPSEEYNMPGAQLILQVRPLSIAALFPIVSRRCRACRSSKRHE